MAKAIKQRDGRSGARIAAALAASVLLAPPVPAAMPLPVVAPAPDCAALSAERTALQAEHVAVRTAIADIALGRNRPRRKVGAGDVGRAAAGTAASLLLPFGLGLAVNAAGAAADKAGKKGRKAKRPPEPEPDVPAMIARQQAIEARLRALAASGC